MKKITNYVLIIITAVALISVGYYWWTCPPIIEVPQNGILQITSRNSNLILLNPLCSKEFVNKQADYIIEGILSDIKGTWNTDLTSNKINAVFQADKYIKGRPLNIKSINIEDIMNFDQSVDINKEIKGRVVLSEGRVRMYLSESQGKLNIICGVFGVEKF